MQSEDERRREERENEAFERRMKEADAKAAVKEAEKKAEAQRIAKEREENPQICNGCTRYDGRFTRGDDSVGMSAGPKCFHPKVRNEEEKPGTVLDGGEFKWGSLVGRPTWCETLGAKLPRSKKPRCHKCAHHREVPGSCHLRCNNPKAKVEGHPQGIGSGWFSWPWNVDPTWLLSCDGYSEDEADRKAPIKRGGAAEEILSIIGPKAL